MSTTNVTGLPLPLFAAISNDSYSRGEADISMSSLLAPARMVALQEKHSAVLTEDAADMAAVLIGKAVHEKIAAYGMGEFDDLRRLFMVVNGWTVSGQTDHCHLNPDGSYTVVDFKTVSVSEWKYGLREERAQQINGYAELLRANGYTVTALSAILIFKDWSATRAGYEKDYPPHSIVAVDVPLWPQEQAQQYILERVLAHQHARRDSGVLCSEEERWVRTKYAVVKGQNRRATRLFETQDEAEEFALSDPLYRVEIRGGEPVRCLHFCSVGRLGLCQQWNGEQ